ncbi:MAG TPA: hypothetical protein VMB50_08175 [Myxococcales bacterium]|nr:hypothetical protein [Myxococcales bacterium]
MSASARRAIMVAAGVWAWLLGACCGPGPTPLDGGGGTGGQASVGPCALDGGCPGGAYCLPEYHECGTETGVSVQIGAGSCYLIDPCSNGDCEGDSCTTDLDCGEDGACDTSGTCCTPGPSGSCSIFSTGGTSGGGLGPQCSTTPSPCPAGCAYTTPPHECPTCLCDTCPPAAPPDGGLDGGEDGGPDGG